MLIQGRDRFSLADAACARGHCRAGAGGTMGWEKPKWVQNRRGKGVGEGASCARRGTPVFRASALGQVRLEGPAARLPSPVPPTAGAPPDARTLERHLLEEAGSTAPLVWGLLSSPQGQGCARRWGTQRSAGPQTLIRDAPGSPSASGLHPEEPTSGSSKSQRKLKEESQVISKTHGPMAHHLLYL